MTLPPGSNVRFLDHKACDRTHYPIVPIDHCDFVNFIHCINLILSDQTYHIAIRLPMLRRCRLPPAEGFLLHVPGQISSIKQVAVLCKPQPTTLDANQAFLLLDFFLRIPALPASHHKNPRSPSQLLDSGLFISDFSSEYYRDHQVAASQSLCRNHYLLMPKG